MVSVPLASKTIRQAIQMREHGQRSITQLILKDGILYYIIVLGIAVFDIIAFVDVSIAIVYGSESHRAQQAGALVEEAGAEEARALTTQPSLYTYTLD